MHTFLKTLAAAACAALAGAAGAVPIDFGAYFRSSAGTSDRGGKEVCTRLPGSVLWFRLGNECDTYADLVFRSTLGE
jgi:maltoporin